MEPVTSSARGVYDVFAPVYDAFTARSDYEGMAEHVEAVAIEHGLCGRRLLDLACGTGNSFIPFLARGYRVTACDISPAMVELAREKAPGVEVRVEDVRCLPALGQHDLVTCIDDGLNYLLGPEELGAAFAGMARTLAPDGVCVFDLNTLHAYRTTFAGDAVSTCEGHAFAWHGEGSADIAAGEIASATIEAVVTLPAGTAQRLTTRHLQRHHPESLVVELLRACGLDCLRVYGLTEDGSLAPHVLEHAHPKALYLAKHAPERG